MESYNLVSFLGIFLLLGFAWLCSSNRRKMNWRVIFWGVTLQLLFAFFIFVLPVGSRFFLFLNDGVVQVLNCSLKGAEFLFGRLAVPPAQQGEGGKESLGFILLFQGLPPIIFFAALMEIFYFLRVMPLVIRGFATIFTKLMRVSGAESLCVSSNIFVGIESSLTVRPYLDAMTASELTTILTAGMATIASSVLGTYVLFLKDQFPAIAGHLISASVLSAPAALVMSKIIFPETETPKTLGFAVKVEVERRRSIFEAIVHGANAGGRLVLGICVLLLAFLSLVALINLFLGKGGGWLNGLVGWKFNWTLEGILGYLFYPFALIIGVPLSDAGQVSRLLGERIVVTELKAYQDLAGLLKDNVLRNPRSAVISAYALCGFAHVASLAIFVGGISALAPKRTADLAALGLRALFAAVLACLLTAAVAGTFFTESSILFWGGVNLG